jgi:hypothetical protein
MTTLHFSPSLRRWRESLRAAAVATLLAVGHAAVAGPGAHGPGGEHLDQAPAGMAGSSALSRIETSTDAFELVATLQAGGLTILVDRYETNEPVLTANLEVESGGVKARAKFRAENGDYLVDDPKFLQQVAAAGEHAIVFTLLKGSESDLLDGTLRVTATADHGHGHSHAAEYALASALALAVAAILLALWRRRRGRASIAALVIFGVAASAMVVAPVAHAAPGAHGPGGEHLDAPGGAGSASGLARLPDGSVNVPKEAQRRMAIRTMLAPEAEAAGTIELPGRVVIDPNAGGRVQAMHGGRIEPGPKGLPVTGQSVRRGEVLGYVRHHAEPYAVGNQQAQLAELRAQRQISEQRVQRLESLEGTVPRKEIDAARAEARGLAERERSVGQSLAAREALVAPVSGAIARADAVLGQVVESRDVLFEIVDPTRLLVEATTADAALAPRIAGAQVQSAPGTRLELLGAARSLRDGVLPLTFSVRAEKAGEALPLAVGQPVTVIVALNERVRGIVLPAQAIVRSPANEPIVWIKSGAERFVPQPVQFRALDARTIVVTAGLGADNRVVVHGAPLIAQIR